MPKQAFRSDKAPRPGGAYSQAIRAGDFVYLAGQGGKHPETNALAESIEEQTRQALENIKAVLEAAGADMSQVVKSTVHLSDMGLFQRYNSVYETYFPDPKPVRTTVGSQLSGAMLVEIDVVAYVGE